MLVTDRDLLVLEPALFARVAWIGQRLVSGTGSIAAGVLTMASQDVGFDAAGIGAGHVVIAGGVAHEVVSRTSATQVVVSRVRASPDDVAVPPTDAAGVSVTVPTFAPQIADAHRRVLALLGLGESGSDAEGGELGLSALVNPGDFERLEAFAALHVILAGAGAAGPVESAEWRKSEFYRARFNAERGRVVARVDLDGDGVADAVRRPSVMRFVRG